MPFAIAFALLLLLTQNFWIAAGFTGFAYVCSLLFPDDGTDPLKHHGEV